MIRQSQEFASLGRKPPTLKRESRRSSSWQVYDMATLETLKPHAKRRKPLLSSNRHIVTHGQLMDPSQVILVTSAGV